LDQEQHFLKHFEGLFCFFQLNSWKERWKRGGKSWERRTKRPLFKRGRKEDKRCEKEEK
jgi:hypothetical protein